jgi:hypothetical protein
MVATMESVMEATPVEPPPTMTTTMRDDAVLENPYAQ